MLNKETIQRLEELEIPINLALPNIERVNFRTGFDVAMRINILGIFLAIEENPDSIPFFRQLIIDEKLEHELSRKEVNILRNGKLSHQEEIDISWYQESLFVLSWTIGVVDKIPSIERQVNLSEIFPYIPPEINLQNFMSNSKLIESRRIILEVEFYYALHWALRHKEAWEKSEKNKICKYNISIVRERRKALEWVINRRVLWDNVFLDT